ncbi:crossover junction endonuclease EME1-like isoform X2 [Physella acuta]|nr:crossover junction endonuclease EME1-like isoform X2 [Physella acuta]
MITVFVDPSIAPLEKQQVLLMKACADIGVKCEFVPQRIERTVSFLAPLTESISNNDVITKEMLGVLNAEDAIPMIQAYTESKQGNEVLIMTLTEWVSSILDAMPGQNLTVLIVGLKKYFSNQKLSAKRKHREAVTGQTSKARKKKQDSAVITSQEAEEAFVEVQLITGCVVQHVDSDEDLANYIKYYTKAVRDKPAKKDRFDSVFSFLEEGASGLYVNKQGQGLSKVWKHQLMQFKNLGADTADALLSHYPSPCLLHKVCKENKEAESVISEINVRRNASVISTNRKIGKEQARRIHTFMTSKDPDQVIK